MSVPDHLPGWLRSRLLSLGFNPEGVLGLAPLARLEFLAQMAGKLEPLIDAMNELRPLIERLTERDPAALIERLTSEPTCGSICESGEPSDEDIDAVIEAWRRYHSLTYRQRAAVAIELLDRRWRHREERRGG